MMQAEDMNVLLIDWICWAFIDGTETTPDPVAMSFRDKCDYSIHKACAYSTIYEYFYQS